jgi:hypothetical protein
VIGVEDHAFNLVAARSGSRVQRVDDQLGAHVIGHGVVDQAA